MAATSDEEKRLLKLAGPANIDITGGSGFGDLLAMMAALRAVSPTVAATAGTTPTAAPAAKQPDIYDKLLGMLTSDGGGGSDLGAAVREMRNTPVVDYQAQQDIAARQAQAVGLAATAAEDAANNRAIARNAVAGEFGRTPALGDMFSKLVPDQDSTLTAFPSGGYATSRTGAQQRSVEAARRAAFTADQFAQPKVPVTGVPYVNAATKRPRYRGGYRGTDLYGY